MLWYCQPHDHVELQPKRTFLNLLTHYSPNMTERRPPRYRQTMLHPGRHTPRVSWAQRSHKVTLVSKTVRFRHARVRTTVY